MNALPLPSYVSAEMHSRRVEPSHDLDHACQRFVDDLRRWAYAAINRYADEPPTDVHDQGTYTTGWEPLLRANADERIVPFLQQTRDRIRDHFTQTRQWRHGYWRMQEAHHGTEHYELFLGALQRVVPQDRETARQLDDAAEHMGNWSSGAPDWFDWDRRRFHSLFFGGDGLRVEPGMALNPPDHLRCVNICLLAASNPQTATVKSRYIELAAAYAGEWADAILAGDALPIALTADGALYQFSEEDNALYYSFMGEAPDLQSEVDRAENLLGSDAINTFLRLWRETGELRFRRAAERVLDPLVDAVERRGRRRGRGCSAGLSSLDGQRALRRGGAGGREQAGPLRHQRDHPGHGVDASCTAGVGCGQALGRAALAGRRPRATPQSDHTWR